MAFYQSLEWHSGEEEMRNTLHVPPDDNPTVPALSPQLANQLQIAPLIAVGTLDAQDRPWTTLWGGRTGLAQRLGGDILGIKSQVAARYDPVVEELVGTAAKGNVVREAEGKGRMVSGVTMDLQARKRVKFYGRMMAGALSEREDEIMETAQTIVEVQLVVKIEQSLGNCPKYLNRKTLQPAVSMPEVLHEGENLSPKALELLAKADLFFISSSNGNKDMDTNHRGGPPGFVRALPRGSSSHTTLCFPEYSGNRLYQTLGNLRTNPRAGICVPDFDTGDILFMTGTTEILIGAAASKVLPSSNLAVKFSITASRHVSSALPFRGIPGEPSPYNPAVRYLASERSHKASNDPESQSHQTATLLSQTILTPTISRFRFSVTPSSSSNATPLYTAGQYVTLDFSQHLDLGYSHMRDDDPQSINDDFIRTFTISSPPPATTSTLNEFELTVRKVGPVTNFLFGFDGKLGNGLGRQTYRSRELDVEVKGFGGEFAVTQEDEQGEKKDAWFIAAGAGVTPLLSALESLDFRRLRLSWTVREDDVPFVEDVLKQYPGLAKEADRFEVFVTGTGEEQPGDAVARLQKLVTVQRRRIQKEDVLCTKGATSQNPTRYYVCTSGSMRKDVTAWLKGEEVIFEDFNF